MAIKMHFEFANSNSLINRISSKSYKDIQQRKITYFIATINLSPLFSYYGIKFRIYLHSHNLIIIFDSNSQNFSELAIYGINRR